MGVSALKQFAKCSAISRCPTFGNLPTGCTMQDNPNDPCCRQPVCTGTVTNVPIPTYGKGFTGYGRPVMPTIGSGPSGMNQTPMPGQPTMISGSGRKSFSYNVLPVCIVNYMKYDYFVLH